MSEQSRSEHILELSKELLDDIELSRTNVENLILKASRLARLVGSEEIRQWLKFEMGGYNCKNRSKPDNDARVRPDAKTEFNRTVKRCSTGH